jgi:hypothetical protein
MADAIDQIINIYRQDDPEHADFYTREWVQDEVASFNLSPEDHLASLLASYARVAALSKQDLNEDQPWTKNLPPDQIEKYCGPIDGASYALMEASGELAKFDELKKGKR